RRAVFSFLLVNSSGFEVVSVDAVVKHPPADGRPLPRSFLAGHDRVRRRLARSQIRPQVAQEKPNAHAQPEDDDQQADKARRHQDWNRELGVKQQYAVFSVTRQCGNANSGTRQSFVTLDRLALQPTAYNSRLMRETRDLLGASQAIFARFLGVSVKTIRAWEQGVNRPNARACRFMDEIRRDPRHWLSRLREAIVAK